MKVLLINTSERLGGAAIACNRLMHALQKNGVEVNMLVRDKMTNDRAVTTVSSTKFRKGVNRFRFLWERMVIWANNGFSRDNLFAVSIAGTGTDISAMPLVKEADVIHLHWINSGFLSLKDIRKLLSLGKPVVWTMHDMWPCTGICHHARECEKFRTGCAGCPFLRFPGAKDLSYKIFNKKKDLSYDKITFVPCSHWLENRARQSMLLKQSEVCAIPNPLDVYFYRPLDKKHAKGIFGISVSKLTLLFGAAKISDPRKGYEYFFRALELLTKTYPEYNDKIELIIFGASCLQLPAGIPYRVHFVGYVNEPHKIVSLYNAADVYVIPSLEENLPNMVMEAMSCGTPVAGFNTGGIPEMIDHLQNGYVAEYKNSTDLMQGICWLLFGTDRSLLAQKAREKVVECYSEERVSHLYLELYNRLSGIKQE